MKLQDLKDLPFEGVSHNPAITKQVLLRRGEVPHVMHFSKAIFQPGQVAVGHAHPDMWETFFCDQGEGLITVNDEEVTLHPGICVTVDPGEWHQVAASPNGTGLRLTVLGIQQ